MLTIKNISFRKYLLLKDRSQYDFALNYANIFKESKDIFKIGDFTQLEFGLIKDLQYDMNNGILWDKMLDYMIILICRKNRIYSIFKWLLRFRLMRLKLTDIMHFKNYIVEQIQGIVKIESIALAYEPTDEELRAGIERLNVYGVYNQLLSVAKNDPLKIDAVKKMKYEEAFVFLCNQKDNNDYEKRLWEIRNQPS